MFDLKAIRTEAQDFDRNWARRGLSAQTPELLGMDEERRAVQTDLQVLQQRRNAASKEIGMLKAKGGDAAALMEEVAGIKTQMEMLETREAEIGEKLTTKLSSLPNRLAADVPDGADESGNIEVKKWGEPKLLNNAADHVAIGEGLGLMNFEAAARMSGARFVWMEQGLARMERALAQFMLDTHTDEHGFMEVSPPLLVRDQAVYGTGQLPKFSEDLFRTENGYWLVPTAEVSLTNYVADQILAENDFPRRMTAFTPCFRSEAGAAGKDTRGIIRQHQFYKVEMVSVTLPEQSVEEHERMTRCAEVILEKLQLPYRRIVLCAGDTGFTATKTYDLEVWLPAQNTYREISSCSNCGDFQSRRMKARVRRADGSIEFLHTLNGSGVAVGRALVAVLENYYNPEDGSVTVPDVLRPYMGGLTRLSREG